MGRRRTGKPISTTQDNEDEANDAQPEENLADFLRNIHQESTESIQTTEGPVDPNVLPGLAWLKSQFKTKSATIRYLVIERGFPVNRVAKHLGLKYQHVRNVSTQQLKRGPNESFHLAEGQAASIMKGDKK